MKKLIRMPGWTVVRNGYAKMKNAKPWFVEVEELTNGRWKYVIEELMPHRDYGYTAKSGTGKTCEDAMRAAHQELYFLICKKQKALSKLMSSIQE